MNRSGDPESQPGIVLPRGLIILCCGWIGVSWVMLFGLRPPIQPVTASYVNAVTMMVLSTLTGIMIGWPLMRTSGRRFTAPFRQTLLDMAVLACAVQVIIWPLRLVCTWSTLQALLLTVELTAWIVVMGALIRIGAGTRPPRVRTGIMTVVMVFVITSLFLDPGEGASWWSPFQTVTLICRSAQGAPVRDGMVGAAMVGMLGIGLWITSMGLQGILGQSGKPPVK